VVMEGLIHSRVIFDLLIAGVESVVFDPSCLRRAVRVED
jgi:hypothetical protein